MTDHVEQTIQAGRSAKALLANEDFRAVLEFMRGKALEQWRASLSNHQDIRETLFFQVRALDAIEAELTNRVEQAELEARRLEQANDPNKRLRAIP